MASRQILKEAYGIGALMWTLKCDRQRVHILALPLTSSVAKVDTINDFQYLF